MTQAQAEVTVKKTVAKTAVKKIAKKAVKKIAKKAVSHKQKKTQQKLGKVSARMQKLLHSVESQREKGKGKVSLSTAQQKESSLIQIAQTESRAKKQGVTQERLAKRQSRKYNKGERAFCHLIALGVLAKRIDPSYIPLEAIKTEVEKLGIDFSANWACIRHNGYQTYTKSPQFTKGFVFCLNVETYDKGGKETCKPFTLNQGFFSVNPDMKAEWEEIVKTAKKDQSLVKGFMKFCKAQNSPAYYR